MSMLPSPPFINVEGISNFRDIGGYRVSNQEAKVRSNYVYRCAEPSRITSSGEKRLRDLGVTVFYDLRSVPEIEKLKTQTPITEIPGIERVFVPVFSEEDYSPERIALHYRHYAANGTEGFEKAYAAILKSGGPSYRQILLHIRDRPTEPFVVHCTAGKDRTGMLAALLLSLVGVDDMTVADEYQLTEFGLVDWKSTIVEHLMKQPAMEGNRESALKMSSAR
ncbi:hypothetical protein MMC14_006299 [Varicellaria rhodocarpa]|nr:hypothetical protein [Varicellaria rhodocarpa]